ncbi:hypothetical protein H5368_11095 [Luteimonas sp. MC1782]|uniref:hypothetical protein n=1 Tax=Luteimonas sp. MC1782 TaxID=2760305 RepID=UPI001603E42F|nr:hypothetical protein [Luteimonas sp. MC1782]MBB1473582.1 hypothetical protein [Luteimonas sp. MC1782]
MTRLPPRLPRRTRWTGAAMCTVLLLAAGCGTAPRSDGAAHNDEVAPAQPPSALRDGFLITADRLDTWNAVGQLLVRSVGVRLEGRSEMLDLHAVSYRGQDILLLTRAVPLSADIRRSTTRVTALARDGAALDGTAAAELLLMLQQRLPAEIERVRALQASGRAR